MVVGEGGPQAKLVLRSPGGPISGLPFPGRTTRPMDVCHTAGTLVFLRTPLLGTKGEEKKSELFSLVWKQDSQYGAWARGRYRGFLPLWLGCPAPGVPEGLPEGLPSGPKFPHSLSFRVGPAIPTPSQPGSPRAGGGLQEPCLSRWSKIPKLPHHPVCPAGCFREDRGTTENKR